MTNSATLPRPVSELELLRHERELYAKTIADAWTKGTGEAITVEQVKTRYREMAQTLAAVARWQPPKDAH